MTEAARLTEADRRIIARARELADASGTEAYRAIAGTARRPDSSMDTAMVHGEALGVAKFLLGEMAAIVARLDGQAAAPVTEDSHG